MKPTLLLLPGLMCDSTVWVPQVQALTAAADCVVIDYALRDSLTDMAQQVLDTAPTPTFALAGHSMGGRVALEVMRLAPERVDRLALLDTGTAPLAVGEAGARERVGRIALLDMAQTQGMRVMGSRWLRGMVHPDVIDTPLFESMLDMLERSSPAQFAAQINALLTRPDAVPLLSGILCPTLVLCGREDDWSTPAQHTQIAAAVAGAHLCVVERCGHMAMLEQSVAVNAALLAWLER